MKFSYDEDADVMYVTLTKPSSKVTYIENDNGDILRLDESTGMIVGFTIPRARERIDKDGKLEIPELGGVPFSDELQKLIKSRVAALKSR
jgi:uncharacterized protein YuzE